MSDSNDGKNKIDAVIDEVVESKHLRKIFGFLFKAVVVLLVVYVVAFLISVVTGPVW